MTAAKTPAVLAGEADPAALLDRIKDGALAFEAATIAAARVGAQLYLDSFVYMEMLVNSHRVESLALAKQTLAASVRRSPSTMGRWYLIGRLISQKGLNIEVVDPTAADLYSRTARSLPKSAQLRILTMLKKGEPAAEVRRAINAAKPSAETKSVIDKGELTKLRCKMEMMGVQTLISQFFDTRVDMIALDKDGNVLLESDG